MNKNTLALAALAACITAACRTTSAPSQNLLACMKIQDANERVHCYDTQIAAMSPAAAVPATAAPPATPSPPPAAPAVAAAQTPAAPPAVAAVAPPAQPAPPPVVAAATPPPSGAPASGTAAQESSGTAQFGEETLPARARPKGFEQSATLESKITDIIEVQHELFVITLANGQVWKQQGDGARITRFFRSGNDARIEKGALGSYHMSTTETGKKNWVLVTRLR